MTVCCTCTERFLRDIHLLPLYWLSDKIDRRYIYSSPCVLYPSPSSSCRPRYQYPVFSLLKSMARAFLADITDDLASSVGHGSLSFLESGNAPKEVDTLSTLDVVGELGEGGGIALVV